MKTLDLNAYGVSEMNQQELVETNGGAIGWIVTAFIVGLIVGVLASDNTEVIVNCHCQG